MFLHLESSWPAACITVVYMRIAFNNTKKTEVFSTKAASARRGVMFSWLLLCLAALWPAIGSCQSAFPPPTTATAQRNALNTVHSQANWLQNNTRTASNLVGEQGYGSLRREFEVLRLAYVEFARTLTPQQLEYGGNRLVELNDGLDIIEGAFANYEDDLAAGKPPGPAFNHLCGVLRQGSALWLVEFDKTASRLRVGWE